MSELTEEVTKRLGDSLPGETRLRLVVPPQRRDRPVLHLMDARRKKSLAKFDVYDFDKRRARTVEELAALVLDHLAKRALEEAEQAKLAREQNAHREKWEHQVDKALREVVREVPPSILAEGGSSASFRVRIGPVTAVVSVHDPRRDTWSLEVQAYVLTRADLLAALASIKP